MPATTRRRNYLILLLLCLGVQTSSLAAQGTAIVPPGDLAYTDIDRLAAFGVLDSIVIGQRPYSRRQMGRVAVVARRRLDASVHTRGVGDDTYSYLDALITRLGNRFSDADERSGAESAAFSILDETALTFNSTNAWRRPILGSFGAPTEATIEPLAERRLGNLATRGSSGAIELAHRLEPLSWLALQLRERVERRNALDSGVARMSAEILLASVRARVRNLALTVGRQPFAWAQSPGDGIMIASDAPALDAVALTGDEPFALPGLFRTLGSAQGVLFVADLGASTWRSHSKLLGYKISIVPNGTVELGGSFLNHFGGRGAPRTSLGDRLADVFPIVDIFRSHSVEQAELGEAVESDKVLGVDARVRFDRLAGVTVSGELLIDDFDVHRLATLVTYDGSQSLRISFPTIGSDALSVAIAAKHTGFRTYTHLALQNGLTSRGRLLGDELGPDATAYSAHIAWTPSSVARAEVELATAEHKDRDYELFYEDAAHVHFARRVIATRPSRFVDNVIGHVTLQSDQSTSFTLRGGLSRTRGIGAGSGPRREFVLDASFRVAQ